MGSDQIDTRKIACGVRKSAFPLDSILKNSKYLQRFGAVSGALALVIAAYYKKDGLFVDEDKIPKYTTLTPKLQTAFDAANMQHIYHSLAMMAIPQAAKKPSITSGLMASGMVLYCGSQYYKCYKEQEVGLHAASLIGGICLLTSWLTLLL